MFLLYTLGKGEGGGRGQEKRTFCTLGENVDNCEQPLITSDQEPTRWQHNRIYPNPINPCVYTYDSRLY